MRSVSRFLIEDPIGYFDVLRVLSYQEEKLKNIESFETSILLQQVRTDASV